LGCISFDSNSNILTNSMRRWPSALGVWLQPITEELDSLTSLHFQIAE
jgi:hypothetical protein